MKSLIKKKDLEITLARLPPHPNPKLFWEQYTIPADVAAEILYNATYVFDDVSGKKIIDLGCGTGRLSIGATILGAKDVFGVDIDKEAIAIARYNQRYFHKKNPVNWIVSDIQCIRGKFDTVLQNPPFGVRIKGMDSKFVIKALDIGKTVYSIHLSNYKNREFIRTLVKTCGGEITHLLQIKFEIPWMFKFHRKEKKRILVDLYRMRKI